MNQLSSTQLKTQRLGFLILFLAFLSACSFLPKEEQVLAPPLTEPPQIEYNTSEVTRGDIKTGLRGFGVLVPKNNHDLHYSQDGGRLKEIHVSAGDEIEEGQVLAELETGQLAFDIQQAQLELEKAEIRLNQMNADQGTDQYTKSIGKLDVQGLRNHLNYLIKQREEAKIISPINGIVTFVSDINQGEEIHAYQTIFQVAETNELLLQYKSISPDDFYEISLGMEAQILLKDEEETVGEVVQIPKSVPHDIAQEDPDFYSKVMNVDIEELPDNVKVGDSLEFEIITASQEDTLLISKNALRSDATGREYVQLMDEHTKREVDIKTGIHSSSHVEVLQGLEEGDIVIQ